MNTDKFLQVKIQIISLHCPVHLIQSITSGQQGLTNYLFEKNEEEENQKPRPFL